MRKRIFFLTLVYISTSSIAVEAMKRKREENEKVDGSFLTKNKTDPYDCPNCWNHTSDESCKKRKIEENWILSKPTDPYSSSHMADQDYEEKVSVPISILLEHHTEGEALRERDPYLPPRSRKRAPRSKEPSAQNRNPIAPILKEPGHTQFNNNTVYMLEIDGTAYAAVKRSETKDINGKNRVFNEYINSTYAYTNLNPIPQEFCMSKPLGCFKLDITCCKEDKEENEKINPYVFVSEAVPGKDILKSIENSSSDIDLQLQKVTECVAKFHAKTAISPENLPEGCEQDIGNHRNNFLNLLREDHRSYQVWNHFITDSEQRATFRQNLMDCAENFVERNLQAFTVKKLLLTTVHDDLNGGNVLCFIENLPECSLQEALEKNKFPEWCVGKIAQKAYGWWGLNYSNKKVSTSFIDYETMKTGKDPASDIARFIGSLWQKAARINETVDNLFKKISEWEQIIIEKYIECFKTALGTKKNYYGSDEELTKMLIENIRFHKYCYFGLVLGTNEEINPLDMKQRFLQLWLMELAIQHRMRAEGSNQNNNERGDPRAGESLIEVQSESNILYKLIFSPFMGLGASTDSKRPSLLHGKGDVVIEAKDVKSMQTQIQSMKEENTIDTLPKFARGLALNLFQPLIIESYCQNDGKESMKTVILEKAETQLNMILGYFKNAPVSTPMQIESQLNDSPNSQGEIKHLAKVENSSQTLKEGNKSIINLSNTEIISMYFLENTKEEFNALVSLKNNKTEGLGEQIMNALKGVGNCLQELSDDRSKLDNFYTSIVNLRKEIYINTLKKYKKYFKQEIFCSRCNEDTMMMIKVDRHDVGTCWVCAHEEHYPNLGISEENQSDFITIAHQK